MGLDLTKIDVTAFEAQLKREICLESFEDFIRAVKPDYQFSWHHHTLIKALQRLADREYRRLIVMMPPRHGKSELVSRLFPAWCLVRNLNEQIIVSSYSLDLAGAMGRDCKRIMTAPEFQSLFPEVRPADGKSPGMVNTNRRFDIAGGKGYYFSAGVGGGITGVGATVAIIDDPVKNAEEADSKTYRDKAWEWYTTTFKTRFEPAAIQVVCQTRWHEDDLTGRILKNAEPGTEIISFPAIAEQKEDSRNVGEALWPDKYDRPALLTTQGEVGSRAWNALYQQRPAPSEGALLKRHWFSTFDIRNFSTKGKRVNFYFDTAYTDKERNDPTAGIAYVKEGANFYVLECLSEWLDFTAQIEFIKRFTEKNGYSPISVIRVEPKATGKTVVEVLKKQTKLNVKEAVAPKDSKVARVNSVAAIVEAGRVHLPEGMSWVAGFLDECASFPNAAHDDRVDCLTGMIISDRGTANVARFK